MLFAVHFLSPTFSAKIEIADRNGNGDGLSAREEFGPNKPGVPAVIACLLDYVKLILFIPNGPSTVGAKSQCGLPGSGKLRESVSFKLPNLHQLVLLNYFLTKIANAALVVRKTSASLAEKHGLQFPSRKIPREIFADLSQD